MCRDPPESHLSARLLSASLKVRGKALIISPVEIGDNLKRIRESRQMTQQELADKAELGLRNVVRLESDATEPQFKTVKRLAEALGVDPSELTGD